SLDVDVVVRPGVRIEVEVTNAPEEPVKAEPVRIELLAVAEQEVQCREPTAIADLFDRASQRTDHVVLRKARHQCIEEVLGVSVAARWPVAELEQPAGMQNRAVVTVRVRPPAEGMRVLDL